MPGSYRLYWLSYSVEKRLGGNRAGHENKRSFQAETSLSSGHPVEEETFW